MNKQEIQKAINHLTMLRRLDSGEKKGLYDLAISALEKQKSKSPIQNQDDGILECPECESQLDDVYDYCPRCGQKLMNDELEVSHDRSN